MVRNLNVCKAAKRNMIAWGLAKLVPDENVRRNHCRAIFFSGAFARHQPELTMIRDGPFQSILGLPRSAFRCHSGTAVVHRMDLSTCPGPNLRGYGRDFLVSFERRSAPAKNPASQSEKSYAPFQAYTWAWHARQLKMPKHLFGTWCCLA
jgi:hypothetical protein